MLNKKNLAQILGGGMEDKKTYLAGACNGYRVTMDRISGNGYVMVVRIFAGCDREEYRAELTGFLNRLRTENKRITEAAADTGTVTVKISLPSLERNYPKCINEAILPVLDFLRSRYFVPCCGCCGSSEKMVGIYNIEGAHHYLCADCAQQIEAAFTQRKEQIRGMKSNVVGGLVGAFLGSLVGAVLWVLIYKMGYIAGLAGLAGAVLAFKGYEKLGGVLDRKGVVISLAVVAAMILLANKIAWSWEAYDELKEYGISFFDVFRHLKDILEETELMAAYIKDLAIGYLLTAFASLGTILGAFRNSSGSFHMKREG